MRGGRDFQPFELRTLFFELCTWSFAFFDFPIFTTTATRNTPASEQSTKIKAQKVNSSSVALLLHHPQHVSTQNLFDIAVRVTTFQQLFS
jgi:hypothetical protein